MDGWMDGWDVKFARVQGDSVLFIYHNSLLTKASASSQSALHACWFLMLTLFGFVQLIGLRSFRTAAVLLFGLLAYGKSAILPKLHYCHHDFLLLMLGWLLQQFDVGKLPGSPPSHGCWALRTDSFPNTQIYKMAIVKWFLLEKSS
jgi:hypothetical protein